MRRVFLATLVVACLLVLSSLFSFGTPKVRASTIPGGVWINPANNFTVTQGGVLHLAAHAYPTNPSSDPPIAYVQFTAYWNGVTSSQWPVLQRVYPTPGTDVFSYDWNLTYNGQPIPSGTIQVSFDVYDQSGNFNLAPNGIHSGTVTAMTQTEPRWALPFSSGTSMSIGPKGIHGDNFRSMSDDSTGKVFTFNNNGAPDSLDMVLEPEITGTSTIPTTSLASGTVLAVWKDCQLVLIDHGNGWWAIYLHMANIQVTSGNTVTTGSVIGYPTTNIPTLPACGNAQSTAEHVHIAFLNGSGTTGAYVPMLGRTLCGDQVVEQNNDPTDIILQGLTTTKDQVFQVPACP